MSSHSTASDRQEWQPPRRLLPSWRSLRRLGCPLTSAGSGGTISGPLPGSLRFVTALTASVWQFGTWVLVGLLSVATLLNVASSSPWETPGWGQYRLSMLSRAPLTPAAGRTPTA